MIPQETPDEVAALEVWTRLLRGNAAARRALSAKLDDDHGLTLSEFEALQLLARAEGRSLRRIDLAEGLGLSASGVTRLLEGLERSGLVGKRACDSDQRVTYATLTGRGEAKLAEASCSHARAVAAFLGARYSGEELTRLAALLERLSGRE